MRFSRIELCGFKSFADKTTVDFSSGITAILGPNGCGKSNIVDAVKWVLGEQKAKSLRGSEMTDVIFAGSERRKPMGMAEVSLFFDNSDGGLPVDFNEVCITRRLYRSGESEYLINKQRCRLRDVRDLFMDTGVGTSAYSFIEQGKVEALLAAKPNERRLVFEEAAGISKYKARRKEALGRLDRTSQYLLRVNDVVEEIEKRIRSVSRQAQSARRYQRLTGELREVKAKLYLTRFNEENDRLTGLQQKLTSLNELRAQEEAAAGSIGSVLTDLQQKELGIEESLSEKERELLNFQQEVLAAESEKARLSERIISLEKEAKNNREQAEALRMRLENLDGEKARLEELKANLATESERLGEQVNSAGSSQRETQEKIASLETEISNARSEQEKASETRSSLSGNLAGWKAESEHLTGRRDSILNRNQSLFTVEKELSEEVERLTAEAAELEKKDAELRQELEIERARMEKVRGKGEELEREINQYERQISGKESRLTTLQELENSMQGLFRGVKAAMEGKKAGRRECSDIEGVVADLITVRPDVALAIETAIGGSQQSIITATARGARDCIEYLKRERAGRATFLPLDKIRARDRMPGNLRNLPGVVGEAIDLVEFDAYHAPAAEYLLNGILVVDTLNNALDIRDRQRANVRMVTLEGDLINPAGAMTGGKDSSQKAGLITRKSEMDELTYQIATIREQLTGLEAQRDEAVEKMVNTATAIRERETGISEIQPRLRESQNRLSGKSAELAKLKEESGNIGGELEGIETKLNELAEKSQAAMAQISELSSRQGGFAEALNAKIAELAAIREQASSASESLTELKVSYARTVQQLTETGSRLESLSQDSAERLQEADRCEARSNEAEAERVKLMENEQVLSGSVGELLSRREKMDAALTELRQQLGLVRAELEEKRNEERNFGRKLNEITESINALKLDERECTMRIESVTEKARTELDVREISQLEEIIRSAGADDDFDDDFDEESEEDGDSAYGSDDGSEEEEFLSAAELETEALEIQEKIRRIGPVNHAAIEELAELKARREFLASERDDLDSARGNLEDLIDKLNNECRSRFDTTFGAVKENFQLLFRRLFGGGKADLVLEETDDPLDAGIEIIARPPGKEPTSISLLSGGEKALCAVALLFSIFRSKPSPFCILDEVDGPLDESNIDRYMDAVRDFSKESQFIIITHSKRTMSMTDTIYGVTQSEPGISRKMSLRFSDGTEEEVEANVA